MDTPRPVTPAPTPLGRLLGWLAVLLATLSVPLALWWTTTERHTLSAARALRGVAKPGDLVVLDARLSGAKPDPAGLMRPLGPLAPVVLDPAGTLPDFRTFPAARVFLVGDLDGARLGLTDLQALTAGVVVGTPAHRGKLLVSLAERLNVSVEKDGQVRPCQGPHLSGGVRCGNQPWQYVGPVVLKTPEHWVACLWAHPIHQGVLRLDVPPQPAGHARFWLQYAEEAVRDGRKPDVTLNAESGGTVLGSVNCNNQANAGRCTLDVDVPGSVPEGTPWLRLTLTTPDAARQLLCLGGELGGAP